MQTIENSLKESLSFIYPLLSEFSLTSSGAPLIFHADNNAVLLKTVMNSPTFSLSSNSWLLRRFRYDDNIVLYHALFWLCYFTFNTVRWGIYYDGDFAYSIKSNLVEFPLHMALAYFTLYVLMPKFLPKKVPLFILFVLASTLAITLFRIVITYELVTTEVFKESGREEDLFGFNYIAAAFIGELYVLGVVSAIKIGIDYIKFRNKASALQKTQLETELAYLKSQIQPHFFFNTLNNLYSLTLDKNDKAPETVIKLSDLMSYVIYDSAKSLVALEDEINHIKTYIDLERLRYGDRLHLTLGIQGAIDHIQVPPLLFIPYIENAFKHGASTTDNCIPIEICFKACDGVLQFSCKNKVSADRDIHKKLLKKSHYGIGLKNTERRLNLRYGNRYDLSVQEKDSQFKVDLKIPVA